MLELFDGELLSAEGVLPSCATFGAEEDEFVEGEVSLFENTEEFLSYGTACANDSDFHCVGYVYLGLYLRSLGSLLLGQGAVGFAFVKLFWAQNYGKSRNWRDKIVDRCCFYVVRVRIGGGGSGVGD